MADTLKGDLYLRSLTPNEKYMIVYMTNTEMKPINILLTINEHNEKNLTTIKQVYNAMNVYRRSERVCITEMQQLTMLLERYMYLHLCNFDEAMNVVKNMFWTHPDSVKLLNSFNIVLMMYNTYKTNRYKIPLLEVVGVTLMG